MKKGAAVILIISFLFVLPSLSFAGNNEWAGKDKFLHFGVSGAITLLGYGVYKDGFGFSTRQAEVAAFLTTVAIGAVKELADDKFSWKDMAADTAGAGFAILVLRIKF